MINEFRAEVYSNNVWNPLDLIDLTLEEALDFSKPTTAKLTLDNFQGNMRQMCTVGNQIRLIRNGSQIYHGIINTPAASVSNNGFLLNLDTTDYYTDKLMKKQTGDAYIWDFVRVTPADLFKCFIGTKFIVQEFFANFRRIDESTINNLCVLDQILQLVKNGSTYQSSGSLCSKTLQNSSDWDTMGQINDVSAILTGEHVDLPLNSTRSSVAYLSDGTQVAANVPRYEYQTLPSPVWQDTFDVDDLDQYTSGGDTAASWTVSGGVLTGSGGTHATLIKNGLVVADCDIVVNTDQAYDAGIIARYQDNNNYYLLAINDDSGRVIGSNFRLHKRVAGTYTLLATADFSWPRGTVAQIRFALHGSQLEAYFNGAKVISVNDTTFTGGSVGLSNLIGGYRVLDFTVYHERQGLLVEEATTNLLTAAQADGTAAVNWNSLCVVTPGDTTHSRHGGSALKVAWNGTQGDAHVLYSLPNNLSPGTSYAFEVWCYAETNIQLATNNMYIQENGGGCRGIAVLGSGYTRIPAGVWTRLTAVGTTPSDWYGPSRIVLRPSRDASSGVLVTTPIWYDMLKVEQKAYATSWIDGGATRSAEVATIPASVFEKGNWTVKLWYTPQTTMNTGSVNKVLWNCHIDAYNWYMLGVGWNGELYGRIMSGGTRYEISSPNGFITPGNTYLVMLTGNGSTLTLYCNGAQVSSGGYVEPVGTLPASMKVGSWDTNEGNPVQCNGIISGLTVLKRVQTLAEHQLEYQNNVVYVEDVKLDVSRDDGTTFHSVPLYYDYYSGQWRGHYDFTGAETVKNKLKYRLTLYSQQNNTRTPTISQVRLDAATASDTGITEGVIEEWVNPVIADDTITQSFPNMSRHQAIVNLLKITGQDAYIDGTGKAHLLNHRGSTTSHVWDTNNNLLNLNYERLREVMANKLTLIGNGTIDTNIGMNIRWSMKDDASIAIYGPIEKTVQERNIADLGVAGARCYTLLQQLKVPGEKVTATLNDAATIDWAVGDNVNITDNTGSTGISPQTTYRITRASRKYNASGETVALELGSAKTELEDIIGATIDLINNYIGVEQANSLPTPASMWTDVDINKPAECLVWIDPTREVKRIILNIFSRKFRANSTGAAAGGGTTTSAGGGQTSSSAGWHTHTVSDHTHSVSVGGHTTTYTNLNAKQTSTEAGHYHLMSNGTFYVVTNIVGEHPTVISSAGGGQTSSGGGDHSHGISDHTHSVPTHTHPIVYGIYEFGYYAPVTMHVNNPSQAAYSQFGVQGDENNAFSVTGFDITNLYSQNGGTGKLGPGTNFIYFKTQATANNPGGLLRLYMDIRVIYK